MSQPPEPVRAVPLRRPGARHAQPLLLRRGVRRGVLVAAFAAVLGGVLAQVGGPAVSSPRQAAPVPVPVPAVPAALLAPVSDGTGLRATGLVAAPPADLGPVEPGPHGSSLVPAAPGRVPYLLAPARRVAPDRAPGLLLVLPASGSTVGGTLTDLGLDSLPDHGLAVAVLPTTESRAPDPDDPARVAAVRDDAVRRSGADAGRVALLGYSLGGLRAYELLCHPGPRFAAVVVTAGTLVGGCPPLSRVPTVLLLHGGADTTVPFAVSTREVSVLGIVPPPARHSVAQLVTAGRCAPPRRYDQPDGVVTLYRACAGGGSVTLTQVGRAGHTWGALQAGRRVAGFLAAALPDVA